jgi:surfeit locus 1 family protein
MRRVAALLIGLGAAAICARLGVWQLHRLAERRALNAEVESRLAAPPLTLTSGVANGSVDSLTYRRARAAGVFAFADQAVEENRSHEGLPGVYVVTPLRFADGTGVLVSRGWAFSPDARTVDLAKLLEPDSAIVDGVLLPPAGRLAIRPESLPVGYPLFPLVLRRTDSSAAMPAGLIPVHLPPRGNGPHLSYAIQWFAFAVIALVGGGLLAWRPDRRRAGGGSPSVD